MQSGMCFLLYHALLPSLPWLQGNTIIMVNGFTCSQTIQVQSRSIMLSYCCKGWAYKMLETNNAIGTQHCNIDKYYN